MSARNSERCSKTVKVKDDRYDFVTDDQLIACDSRIELDAFKKLLNDKFECSDGGPVNYFLGINIY